MTISMLVWDVVLDATVERLTALLRVKNAKARLAHAVATASRFARL